MWDVQDVLCSRCGMFGMWDVRNVGCSGYEMFGMCRMWDVQDVGCSRCAIFGMWDVGCLLGCGMLIYKMPKIKGSLRILSRYKLGYFPDILIKQQSN